MGDVQENWNPELFKNDIKQIVSRISRIDVAEMDDRVLIREELGIDSLMAMEIIAGCEKLLGVRIDETLFADVQTVGDFFELLLSLCGRVNA
ncbi:MAG: acyl carrier protein [Spirochaetia bacterium]